MKSNTIKKFLICAFVSAVGVVSYLGDKEVTNQKTINSERVAYEIRM